MSIRACNRCSGTTKLGLRCKLRTCKSKLCWLHLKSIHGLRIKKSKITGAFDGLWTLKDIRNGENIGPYDGELLSYDPKNNYSLELDKNHFIDGKKTDSSYTRYINTCKLENRRRKQCSENNAAFIVNRHNKTARVKAKQNIKANSEILASYGWNYPIY